MKNLIVLLAIWMVLFTFQAVQGQTVKRIQFAKGRSSARVQGVTGVYGVTYVVRARSGQKLVLTLMPRSRVGIKVQTDGSYGQQVLLREESGGTYEVGLEEGGDYTIFMGSTNSKSAAYSLTVKIVKMTDI